MRRSTFGIELLALLALAVGGAGCHESELEPKTPEGVWDMETPGVAAEASYTMAPVPAVMNPAPLPRERPRSISLGYIGDAPLAGSPPVGPHWPYVQEPFHYREPYGPRLRGGRYVRVPRPTPMQAYAVPGYLTAPNRP